jgi:hypothetical protein
MTTSRILACYQTRKTPDFAPTQQFAMDRHAGGGKARRSFRPLAVPTTVRLKVKQNRLVAGVK